MKRWIIRIVLALVALPVLLVLALFAASKRPSAGTNDASIVVDRPAAEVFLWFTDLDRTKQWVGGLTDAKELPNGHLLMTMGEGGGEHMQMDEERVAFEPNARLTLKIHPPPGETQTFEEVADFTFVEKDGKTTVRVVAHTTYNGIFALLEPLITRSAQKKLDEHDFPALKRLVEAERSADARL